MDILTLIVLIIMGLMPVISGIVILVLMIKYDYDCEKERKEIIQILRDAYREPNDTTVQKPESL